MLSFHTRFLNRFWPPLVLTASLLPVAAGSAQPTPLPNAHAHNDYMHERPLLEALERGFCNVEADIFLVDGQLLVAHDREKVSPELTLQKLYLDPLLTRVHKNNGKVHPGAPEFVLLIDVKSEAEPTYAALKQVLLTYSNMLTRFSDKRTETNAVTIVLSGNRAQTMVAAEAVRYVSIDGRLPDLELNPPRHLLPLVSDNFSKNFQWHGEGPLPEDEKIKLTRIVQKAHQQGRKVRFWAAPDTEAGWGTLLDCGVDLLNTDHLADLQKFLNARSSKPPH
ncbi:MAG TPA: phosphatidylinositol-specific phospholipase C/glycerophosphodiester phosphodiesterase family protein [Verrucomicrobiae bacterium]